MNETTQTRLPVSIQVQFRVIMIFSEGVLQKNIFPLSYILGVTFPDTLCR